MKSNLPKSGETILDFESSIKKIESLINSLENSKSSLQESLSSFESGIKLIGSTQQTLTVAEQKVQTLIEENDKFSTNDFSEDDPGR